MDPNPPPLLRNPASQLTADTTAQSEAHVDKLSADRHPSDLENQIDGENHAEEVEILNVAGPLLPLVTQQGYQRPDWQHVELELEDEAETLWIAEWQRAPEYLNLLYDLAISSVLSVFGDQHPILDGPSIAAYFSYFVIIWWVWASQVVYDSRFQANDWIHRLFKLLQLGAFTYIGVFAQQFNPTMVVQPPDLTSPDAVTQHTSALSWQGAAIAYAVSRLLLFTQYSYVACVTHPDARRARWSSFWIPMATCLFSALFWFISGLIRSNPTAKLVLGYFALATEMVITVVASTLPNAIPSEPEMLGTRFADLTVVILAEGVLGIVKTLASVVSGFGLNAGSNSELSGYSECISSLVIVFGTWHFLFHAFDEKQSFRNRRTSIIWTFLHLPLHFVILLLLKSMSGVAVFGNLFGAVDMLSDDFGQVLDATGVTGDTATLDSLLSPNVLLQFNKLSLDPPFETEVNRLNTEYIAYDNFVDYFTALDPNAQPPSSPTTQPPANDPYIESVVYFSTAIYLAAQTYGVSFSSATTDLYHQLTQTSSAWITTDPNWFDDANDMGNLENTVSDTYDDYIFSYVVDIAAPVQLFFPSAGGLIILAAVITVLRIYGVPAPHQRDSRIWKERQHKSLGRQNAEEKYPELGKLKGAKRIAILVCDWLPFGVHLAIGIALCFCGFLDTPVNTLDSDIDSVLGVGWALPTVAFCYGGLMVLDCIVLLIGRKARGGRFMHRMHPALPRRASVIQSEKTKPE